MLSFVIRSGDLLIGFTRRMWPCPNVSGRASRSITVRMTSPLRLPPMLAGDQEVLSQAFRVFGAIWTRFGP